MKVKILQGADKSALGPGRWVPLAEWSPGMGGMLRQDPKWEAPVIEGFRSPSDLWKEVESVVKRHGGVLVGKPPRGRWVMYADQSGR